ncbi:hypothetical protein MIR68_002100 [Amoeboaphelidium protococcarum]|nr:hypothetical protein MIR68_002100 [Amoeboaphelidium protococcarum]
MTKFFCPFCTKSTKIKRASVSIIRLAGNAVNVGSLSSSQKMIEKRLWQLDGWMVKQLICETTKSPYDPLLQIDYCKRTKTTIGAVFVKNLQTPVKDGNKYNFVWYFSMRKHRQNYQITGIHLLGDAECFHCDRLTHQTSTRHTRSARNQLTTAVKNARARSMPSAGSSASNSYPAKMSNNDPLPSAALRTHLRDAQFVVSELAGTSDSVSTASKSSLVTCYQTIRPLTVDGANHIALAKLKESSVLRLFVNAANLEMLVMYFRRLGSKAAETKLCEWKKHSLMNNILRILFEFSLMQSYGVRNARQSAVSQVQGGDGLFGVNQRTTPSVASAIAGSQSC